MPCIGLKAWKNPHLGTFCSSHSHASRHRQECYGTSPDRISRWCPSRWCVPHIWRSPIRPRAFPESRCLPWGRFWACLTGRLIWRSRASACSGCSRFWLTMYRTFAGRDNTSGIRSPLRRVALLCSSLRYNSAMFSCLHQ